MILSRLLSISCYNKYTQRAELHGAARLEQNRELILESLDRAEAFSPDFIVFPELGVHAGVAATPDAMEWAETVPGPMIDATAEKARKLNSHILMPLFEKDGGLLYNSAVLIGRDGNIMGTYRKFRATGYEIKDGVQPGVEVPVWQTDRGPVGCATCFDLEYDDVALALARGKARVVFWPTMFWGGRRMEGWSLSHGFYMVKSGGGHGAVSHPLGHTITEQTPVVVMPDGEGQLRWTFAQVNTDFKVYHPDYNRDRFSEIIDHYNGGVQIELALNEARVMIISNLPDVSIEDVEKAFGLQDLRDYLDDAERIRNTRVRRGNNP